MGNNVSNDITVNTRSVIVVSLISVAYLLLSSFVVGFKSDQVVLVVISNVLFYSSKTSRKFILAFCTFISYWIIFDYMKALPNYTFNPVHIGELYNLEKHLFGIHFKGEFLTPNEYLKLNSNSFLDILSGLFYLCWIPVPLGFGTYLFLTKRDQFLPFAFTFVVVNLFGFVIYYSY